MPAERFASEESGPSAARAAVLWALPVVFLVGVWLWLVFSSGGYATEDWAFQAMTLGVAGIVIAALAVFPRRPGQLSLAVLALFTGYAVWVLASNLWAESSGNAWQATGRTFMYLLVLTLALTFFASARARLAFKYLVMAGALALLAGCVVRLWTAETAALFVGNRFVFPIGQANAASALFLVPFWPLVWLAAGPDEPAPVRGAAIGLATGLVGLALLTQSRGAVWSLGITLIFLFAVSPGQTAPAVVSRGARPAHGVRISGAQLILDAGASGRQRGHRRPHPRRGGRGRGLHRDDRGPAGEVGQGERAHEGDLRDGRAGRMRCRPHLRSHHPHPGRRRPDGVVRRQVGTARGRTGTRCSGGHVRAGWHARPSRHQDRRVERLLAGIAPRPAPGGGDRRSQRLRDGRFARAPRAERDGRGRRSARFRGHAAEPGGYPVAANGDRLAGDPEETDRRTSRLPLGARSPRVRMGDGPAGGGRLLAGPRQPGTAPGR